MENAARPDTAGSWWLPTGRVFFSAPASDTPAQELAEATSRWRKASLELEVPEELVKSQQLRESRLQ